jgi:hypothetical protein
LSVPQILCSFRKLSQEAGESLATLDVVQPVQQTYVIWFAACQGSYVAHPIVPREALSPFGPEVLSQRYVKDMGVRARVVYIDCLGLGIKALPDSVDDLLLGFSYLRGLS